MEESKKPRFTKKQILYYSLIGVFAAIFIACAIYLGCYLVGNYQQRKKYDDLNNIKEQNTVTTPQEQTKPSAPPEPDSTEPQVTEPPVILPEYQPIYDLNNDTVGWIDIPGTKVHYPVLMPKDEMDFYLYRDFYKQDSRSGAIYIRPVSDVFAPSDNVTIYGHHMKTGDMFGDLKRYNSKNFWEKHQTMNFDTIYEKHQYQIFAVFKTSGNVGEGFPYHLFVDAPDAETFNQFVSDVKDLALYDTGVSAEYGDKLICLSTCEYTLDNGRFVVVAKRIS